MNLTGKKVAFLGDSITEGVGTTAPEKRYTDLLAARMGFTMLNYGISGTRFARQKAPSAEPLWDLDFCRRAKEMDESADAVIVFGGTNDFGHGDAPFGTFEDRGPDTFCGACHTLMRTLLERYPGKPIVFLTPLHRASEDNLCGDCKPAPVAPLSDYVDMLKKIAAWYSIPVCDLWSTSLLNPRVDVIVERFMPDGLHPSDAGHVLLANRIEGFLRSL